jgi:predicted metalloprotease with PDZ domain
MSTERSLSYHLQFTEPQANLVDVELDVENPESEIELWMPTWTPGSYLIREYSRHVQELTAEDPDGNPLPWKKTAKNTWLIETGEISRARIRYRIYGHEMSVRTNWIGAEFALLNGAATVLTVRGREKEEHHIRVTPPRTWAGVWTQLAVDPKIESTPHTFAFLAHDLDEVVDSPILAGNPAVHDFEVDGVPFSLLNVGEGGLWDGERSAADTRTIVETYRTMYGSLPLDRYLFMNLIVEGRGGLEHKNSSVLMTSRYVFRRRPAYIDWLGLVSHEFFHVWNVKRSRPEALGPFDYENENYTRALWVAEGVTAYYTDLVPCRAGLTQPEEYLKVLGDLIDKLQNTPGRGHQSLEESSHDAWIKLYRPDENTANTTVSYYLKGALVTWLLDVEIRSATGGKRSLDDVMRLLFERYSGERGFSDQDVQSIIEKVAGQSLPEFFDRYVRGREELDYDPALASLGLRFKPFGEGTGTLPPVWLGLEVRGQDGRLVVRSVREGGPARDSGINFEDEIMALGGYRVTPQTFTERLHQYSPGDRVEILIARRDAIQVIPVTLEASFGSPWRLELDPGASGEATAARAAWLHLDK